MHITYDKLCMAKNIFILSIIGDIGRFQMYISLSKCHLFDILYLSYHDTVKPNGHKVIQGMIAKKYKQINMYTI